MSEPDASPTSLRGYRFRFEPTLRQRRYLARAFGVSRFVFNWALALRREAYQRDGTSIGFAEISRRLTALKAEKPWLAEVDRQLQTQSLRDQERAFSAFFQNRARYPRFKSRRGPQSVRVVIDQRSQRKRAAWSRQEITLPLMGRVRFRNSFSEAWPVMPKLMTISRDACGSYFLSFSAPSPWLAQAPDTRIGVDVGIADLAVTSAGWKSGALKVARTDERRLKRYQRQLARRKPGSRRRQQARVRLARLQRRIACQRRNFLHQVSHRIASSARTVVLETLNVKGMQANHNLAAALGNASLSELHRQIRYKVQRRQGSVIQVDPWMPSSKTCSACGYCLEDLPLSVRQWSCPACGTLHDRDINAARNLMNVGPGRVEVTRSDWRGSGLGGSTPQSGAPGGPANRCSDLSAG